MDRADRETWAKRVERWGDGGLSAREFAGELGIQSRSLRWWKWRLAVDAEVASSGKQTKSAMRRPRKVARVAKNVVPLTFVELSSPGASAASPIEIVLRSGTQLRVPTGFDSATLESVLEIVERRA